ncbi:MAG: response regulator [Verrucomicrobia bacterium]|nr:response regulator [Verrucomicrobiota bacterium]
MNLSLLETPLRVLVIEDDREDYLLTRELLADAPGAACLTEWRSTLQEGLTALMSGQFHACFTDHRIGADTGIELLEMARSHACEVPIVMLTGQREPAVEEMALKAGAADYLIKGTVDGAALLRSVRFSIARQRVLQAAAADKQRLAALGAAVGRALTQPGTVAEVLQPCAEALARSLPIELAQIHVFHPKRGELRMTASAGTLSDDPPQHSLAAIDFVQGGAFLSCPASEDHRLGDTAWFTLRSIRCAVTYPLNLNEHLLGVITLYSREALSNAVVSELGSVAPGIGSYLARLSLEAQVRRAQQLDCVGKMAAGLAHEFKNNLMVIRTHVDQMLPECAARPEVMERLQAINAVTSSATRLAQQLMLFSRPQGLEPRPLDLNDTLRSMRPIIQGALDQRVCMSFQCEAKQPVVEADQGLLHQVIINLAVNARDAMPEGGRLFIRTDNVDIDSAKAATNPDAVVGRFVRIQVTDTGSGMTPETLARVFEPFFTTKEPGKGNGLGLATVFNIIREHHGWIEVGSEVGKGTTFRIYLPESTKPLPVTASNETEQPPLGSPAKPASGKAQRVLIVEDEPVLRMAAEQALEQANYRVFGASSGQEAIKVWEDQDGAIDLLLTDLSMPEGMSGVQLAEQLVRRKPGLKVILTSGYAAEMVDHNLRAQDTLFIQKPYSLSALPESVGRCLGI